MTDTTVDPNDLPTDPHVTQITSAVGAIILLLVAFGLQISTEQKLAVLGVIAPVWVVVQGLIAHFKTTANNQVVARVDPQKQTVEAVAGSASVYDNGTRLQTVPQEATDSTKAELLHGVVKPNETNYVGRHAA